MITITKKLAKELLPERSNLSHKGSFGNVLMFVSSVGMPGAASLASVSAYKSGVGLVRIACPSSIVNTVSVSSLESVFLPLVEINGTVDETCLDICDEYIKNASTILIGCGLGECKWVKSIILKAFEYDKPLVIDADGINFLKDSLNIIQDKNVILTPHAKEFSRITGLSVPEILKDREIAARNFVNKYHVNLLLKGPNTLIFSKDYEYVLPVKDSSLSTAGSGDVLSGIISSFSAQGLSLLKSGVLASYIHAKSGKIASKKLTSYGVTARDIRDNIPFAIKKLMKVW